MSLSQRRLNVALAGPTSPKGCEKLLNDGSCSLTVYQSIFVFHAELTLPQPFKPEDRLPYEHWGGTNHQVREPAPETGFGLSAPESGSQLSLLPKPMPALALVTKPLPIIPARQNPAQEAFISGEFVPGRLLRPIVRQYLPQGTERELVQATESLERFRRREDRDGRARITRSADSAVQPGSHPAVRSRRVVEAQGEDLRVPRAIAAHCSRQAQTG